MSKTYLYQHPDKPGKMVTRQRLWQLRKQKAGLCGICGKPTDGSFHCLKHRIRHFESVRKLKGSKRRNWGARIYQVYKPK